MNWPYEKISFVGDCGAQRLSGYFCGQHRLSDFLGCPDGPHTDEVSAPESFVTYRSRAGRGVIVAATLGSGMTFLDATVVNVALRTIGEDLGADLADLQWISNGYLLSLAALILLGGSLGDRFGRRRIFLIGVVWFAVASLLCGLAVNPEMLIVARLLQGVGAAMVTPGSLAMIQGAFAPKDRGPAIGAWTGLAAISNALGPFLGGFLIDYASWRWIFLINVPIAVATVWLTRRCAPESRDERRVPSFDVLGALLAAASLAGVTYALIEWGTPTAVILGLIGLVAAAAFIVTERLAKNPMMPLELFANRTFSAANIVTLLVYAAMGAIFFFVVLQLQTVTGYSALAAGVATLPITVCMLLLAAPGGKLGARIGPRIPMTFGPLVMAGGIWLLAGIGADSTFVIDVLPGMTIFGLGLALTVAPLTASVLAAAPDRRAGIASGINNAVARSGSLLAVAALPLVVGLSGDDYNVPAALDAQYGLAMWISAVLLALGGVMAWFTIPAGMQEIEENVGA